MPTFTLFVTGGWPQVARLRADLGAVDHFPDQGDYEAFCREFGEPPR